MLTLINTYLTKIKLIICFMLLIIFVSGCGEISESINAEQNTNEQESIDIADICSIDNDEKGIEVQSSKSNEKASDNTELDLGSLKFDSYIDAYDYITRKLHPTMIGLPYVNKDDTPELLLTIDSEYKLYSYDESIGVKEIAINPDNKAACTYCKAYGFGKLDGFNVFCWFEYVPYNNIIRIHNTDDFEDDYNFERHDYYIRIGDDGTECVTELEAYGHYDMITKYKNEIVDNDIFLNRRIELGYDKLIPLTDMYDDLYEAYFCLGKGRDENVIEDFLTGKTRAVVGVNAGKDIVLYRSYEQIVEYLTYGEKGTYVRILDINDDGRDDLEVCGYDGQREFYIATGNALTLIKYASSTVDMCEVTKSENRTAIKSYDNMHADRVEYRYIKYDACGCPYDCETIYHWWNGFELNSKYSEGYKYRGRPSNKEEFENILNKYTDIDVEYTMVYVEE